MADLWAFNPIDGSFVEIEYLSDMPEGRILVKSEDGKIFSVHRHWIASDPDRIRQLRIDWENAQAKKQRHY